MRSAANVASASWMATAGSLSPVSPAASTPSSSSRSTVSSCAESASPIASSESETQNATFERLVAGGTTSPPAPSTSAPSVGRRIGASTGSGVRTSSFIATALPRGRRAGNGSGSPPPAGAQAQHDDRDIVAQPPLLHQERLALDRLG